MGGKNPCIVTEHADLERAAAGIVRSAFGMGGQKCSALSRLYVHESVADELIERMQEKIAAIRIGDARQRENWLGPVVNASAYANYANYIATAARPAARNSPAAARQLREGDLARGYYVEPIAGRSRALASAVEAGDVPADRDAASLPRPRRGDAPGQRHRHGPDRRLLRQRRTKWPWFHEHIEAGVTYANRPQGATTGAWPGYQPFGGWKGSGSTGKAIASFYYLQQYLREQSRTVVE